MSVQIPSATTTNLCYDSVVDIVADSNVGSASAVISICVGCWGLPLAAFHVLRVFVSCLWPLTSSANSVFQEIKDVLCV